mgnify:CR=1 FL=1
MRIRGAVVSAVLIPLVVAGCSHTQSATQTGPTSATTPASSAAAPSSTKAYDLGRHEIGNVAFWQYNGTATAPQKACEAVVDTWTAADKAQPWWNREEVLRGCLDRVNGPADSTSPTAPAAPTQAVKECPAQGGNQIKIYSGDISCADAYLLAGKYDLQGQKYQQINSVDTWTCYTGTADTRPLVFSCVSENNAEFGVYSAP